MEVTLKLGELIKLNKTLKSIIDDSELKIDTIFKFRLLGILKSIELPIKNFEMIRDEKIMEFGKETEDGTIQIPMDDVEAIRKFNDSLAEIINSDVKIIIDKLKADEVFKQDLKADYLVELYLIIEK